MHEVEFLGLVQELNGKGSFDETTITLIEEIKQELQQNPDFSSESIHRANLSLEAMQQKISNDVNIKIEETKKLLKDRSNPIDEKTINDRMYLLKITQPCCNNVGYVSSEIKDLEVLNLYRGKWDEFIIEIDKLEENLGKSQANSKLAQLNKIVETTNQKQREFQAVTNPILNEFRVELKRKHDEAIRERGIFATANGILQSLDLSGEFVKLSEQLKSISPEEQVEYFADENAEVQSTVSREVALAVLPKRWLKFLINKIDEYLKKAEESISDDLPIPDKARSYLEKIDNLDLPEGISSEILLRGKNAQWDIGEPRKEKYSFLDKKISESKDHLEMIRAEFDKIYTEKAVDRFIHARNLKTINKNEVFFKSEENGISSHLELFKNASIKNLEMRISKGKTKIQHTNSIDASSVLFSVIKDIQKCDPDVPKDVKDLAVECKKISDEIIEANQKISAWIETTDNPKEELENNKAAELITDLYQKLKKVDITDCEELTNLQNRVTSCQDLSVLLENSKGNYHIQKISAIQESIRNIKFALEREKDIPSNLKKQIDQASTILHARLSLENAKIYIDSDLSQTNEEMNNLEEWYKIGIFDDDIEKIKIEEKLLRTSYQQKLGNEKKIKELLGKFNGSNPSNEFDQLFEVMGLPVTKPIRERMEDKYQNLKPIALMASCNLIDTKFMACIVSSWVNDINAYYHDGIKNWDLLRESLQRIERIDPELSKEYLLKTNALESYFHGLASWLSTERTEALKWMALARELNPQVFSDIYFAFLSIFTFHYEISSLSSNEERITSVSSLLKTNPVLMQDIRMTELLVTTQVNNAEEMFDEDPANYDTSIRTIAAAKKTAQRSKDSIRPDVKFINIQKQITKIENIKEQSVIPSIDEIIKSCMLHDKAVRTKKQIINLMDFSTRNQESPSIGVSSKSGNVILAFHLYSSLVNQVDISAWWEGKKLEAAANYRQILNGGNPNDFDSLDNGLSLFLVDNNDPLGIQAKNNSTQKPLVLPIDWENLLNDITGGTHQDLVSSKDKDALSVQVLLLKEKKFQYDTLKTVFIYFDNSGVAFQGITWQDLVSQLQTAVLDRNILSRQQCYGDAKKIVDEIRNKFSAARVVNTDSLLDDPFNDFLVSLSTWWTIEGDQNSRDLKSSIINRHRTIAALKKDINREKETRETRIKLWMEVISFLRWQELEGLEVPELGNCSEVSFKQLRATCNTTNQVLDNSKDFVSCRIMELRKEQEDKKSIETRSVIEEAETKLGVFKDVDSQNQSELSGQFLWKIGANNYFGFDKVKDKVHEITLFMARFRDYIGVVFFGREYTVDGQKRKLGKPVCTEQSLIVKDLKEEARFNDVFNQIENFINYDSLVIDYLEKAPEGIVLDNDIKWYVRPLEQVEILKMEIKTQIEILKGRKGKIEELQPDYITWDASFASELNKIENSLFHSKTTPKSLVLMYAECPKDPNNMPFYKRFGLVK